MEANNVFTSEESLGEITLAGDRRATIDAALTRRLNEGDSYAFREAYDQFAPDIFRHVRFRIRSTAEADEIAQQTFLQTWERIRGHRKGIESVRGFLYGVAHHLVVDWYRKAARRPESELTEAVVELHGEKDIRMHGAAEDTSDLRLLRRLLDQIRVEYRDMILWRYVDGLEVDEIAALTGKTANNVYVITHRALEALRREYERTGEIAPETAAVMRRAQGETAEKPESPYGP